MGMEAGDKFPFEAQYPFWVDFYSVSFQAKGVPKIHVLYIYINR